MQYKIKMFVPICLDASIFLFGARNVNFAIGHKAWTEKGIIAIETQVFQKVVFTERSIDSEFSFKTFCIDVFFNFFMSNFSVTFFRSFFSVTSLQFQLCHHFDVDRKVLWVAKTRTKSLSKNELWPNTCALYINLFLSLSSWLVQNLTKLCPTSVWANEWIPFEMLDLVLHMKMWSPNISHGLRAVNKRDSSLFCMIMCCTLNSLWLTHKAIRYGGNS